MPMNFRRNSLLKLFWLYCVVSLLSTSGINAEEASQNSAPDESEDQKSAGITSDGGIEVWIGTAPFCKGSADDCQIFDLKFIREDARGNGAKCWTGQKVLCRQKQLTSKLVSNAPNELVVAVYNVYEPAFSEDHIGQTERTCHIPRALLNKYPDLDVIILVDLFVGGCIQNGQSNPPLSMGHMLARYGFGHATSIVGEESRSFTNTNGGTVIVSRWPITSTKELEFTNYAGLDRFIGRGAVYAEINKHGLVYHVVGTQLQSGAENEQVRFDQAKELATFISDLELPSKHPVIIGGDFQTDYLNNEMTSKSLVKELFAEMPPIVGDIRVNVDQQSNELVQPETNPQEWRDFILSSSRHQPANHATLESSQLVADKSIRYCASAVLQPTYVSPTAVTCRREKTTSQLSDHYPVVGRFTFNTNERNAPKEFKALASSPAPMPKWSATVQEDNETANVTSAR